MIQCISQNQYEAASWVLCHHVMHCGKRQDQFHNRNAEELLLTIPQKLPLMPEILPKGGSFDVIPGKE